MHWRWEKCPYGWKGMYTRGDHGVPTIILEAVASHYRCPFGPPGPALARAGGGPLNFVSCLARSYIPSCCAEVAHGLR
jgi:hypothetical protein